MVDSVCATAMATAKGMTIGITAGRISQATSKKVPADCPLVVTRSMRLRIWVVQTMARTQNIVAAKNASVRRII